MKPTTRRRDTEARAAADIRWFKAVELVDEERRRIELTGVSEHAPEILAMARVAIAALWLLPVKTRRLLAGDAVVWPAFRSAFVHEQSDGKLRSIGLGTDLPIRFDRHRGADSIHTAVAADAIAYAVRAWRSAKRALSARRRGLSKRAVSAAVMQAWHTRAALPPLTRKTLDKWRRIFLKDYCDRVYEHCTRDGRPGVVDGPEVDTQAKRRNYFRKHVLQSIRGLLPVA